MDYNPQIIEENWRKRWQEQGLYQVPVQSSKPKYYVLDMFPYPSGAGLHVGHPLGYVASDIISRYKGMQGFEVLHPMGYDAFGLPAEQYAIQTGIHPAESTAKNIERYRGQLDKLGFSFDWSRQVNTSDPKYYRWTQELFLLLFSHYYDTQANKAKPLSELIACFEQEGNTSVQAACNSDCPEFSAADWAAFSNKECDDILMNYRLAYRKESYVNWCEALGSVLANDEVVNGLSERGGHPVSKRKMLQWSLRISAYAQRLLDGLDTVDFSESIKTQQRNWIGRSQGARVFFSLPNSKEQIEVFTTRPDTLYGVSFLVLAPEHPLVQALCTEEQAEAVQDYLEYCGSRSERERMTEVKKITGVDTGAKAIHPLTGEQVAIWISEYVLAGYGTGAIMAVPAEDERDNRFAKHFNLPIVEVLDKSNYPNAGIGDKLGQAINSPEWNGLSVEEALNQALQVIEAHGIGQAQINFRLRDANFSRQRYWGEPIPIVYDAEGCAHAYHELPLELPPLDNFKPTADGASPLARLQDWVNSPEGFTRETDTMPGFAGSSWYFLRYMDPHNSQEPFSQEAVNYWQQVDLYVGGAEHAVGHLLYSRCWHKFLFDLGKVPTDEPYKKLINQGMIQGMIEYVCLLKEKQEGQYLFVSSEVAETLDEDAYVKIHLRSDLVQEDGKGKYLDTKGVEGFIEWMPDYAQARFQYNEEGKIYCQSEIGKMSKRYHNVVNPDDVVAQYGADCFRLYEMFLGPLEQSKPWDPKNIEGTYRFLRRFWALFYSEQGQFLPQEQEPSADELRALHTAIKKVNADLQQYSMNTCVAHFMSLLNELRRLNCYKKGILLDFLRLLAPFAPHISEELWQLLGQEGSVHKQAYPQHKEEYLQVQEIEYPICVNGKVRSHYSFGIAANKKEIEETALGLEEVQRWIEGKAVKKIIVVPKRMVNIVV